MTDNASLIALATLVVGFLWQAYRENRNHRWEREEKAQEKADRAELARNLASDNAALATKVATEASRVAAHVVDSASRVANQVASENAKLAEKIDDNTAISTKAFYEANSVNLKIAALGIENNKLQREHNERVGDKKVVA